MRVRTLLGQALGGRELAHVSLALILLAFLALPVAHALRLGSVVPIVFGFGLVLGVSRIKLSDRAALIAIVVCFAVFLTLEILILANHRVEPVNDFRTQWDAAIDYAEHGLGVPDRPQTQRAIPFYYPLVLLFGKSPGVYLVANAILTSLTFLMSVWVARRYFGWPAAAKTAMLLLFTFEPYFANTFPSHDIFGSFGVLLFLCFLVEIEVLVSSGGFETSRRRSVLLGVLCLLMSLEITWVDWQRTMGVFCLAALLFYGVAAVVQRAPRARLRIAIVIAVGILSTLQSCGLQRCGLVATPAANQLTSSEMNLLTFGTDEGDGRFADWYRNARMAAALEPDQVARLSKAAIAETVQHPGSKYENFLERELNFFRTGRDTGWYLTIESPRWLSDKQIRSIYQVAMKYTPPIWWALALLLVIATIARREALFDARMVPLILIAAFAMLMGLLGEAQSRYAMFMVFLWPIYAGSPLVANPLAGIERSDLFPPNLGTVIGRTAISVVAVIAIPLVVLAIAPRLFGDRLASLDRVEVAVERTPSSTGDLGGVAEVTAVRNLLTVSDAVAGSQNTRVTIASKLTASRDDSTLRFVIYNELGGPLELPSTPVPAQHQVIAGRSLRVIVDGAVRRTIDLSSPSPPRAYEVSGFDAGDHDLGLELDLGESPVKSTLEACEHRWTSPAGCTNTSIGYLGFY